jgi:cytoskeletal protein CcmA (bactofilin family)
VGRLLAKKRFSKTPEDIMAKEKEEWHTLLGKSTNFDGKLTFNGTVRLEGRFRGEVDGKNGTLIIGEHGVIDASILVSTVIVSGEVKGDIHAEDRIEIHPPARVFGDITAPTIVIDEGVVFQGSCTMKSQAAAQCSPSQPAERERKGETKKKE